MQRHLVVKDDNLQIKSSQISNVISGKYSPTAYIAIFFGSPLHWFALNIVCAMLFECPSVSTIATLVTPQRSPLAVVYIWVFIRCSASAVSVPPKVFETLSMAAWIEATVKWSSRSKLMTAEDA